MELRFWGLPVRGLGRSSVVDDVVLNVVWEALAGVEALLQLGVCCAVCAREGWCVRQRSRTLQTGKAGGRTRSVQLQPRSLRLQATSERGPSALAAQGRERRSWPRPMSRATTMVPERERRVLMGYLDSVFSTSFIGLVKREWVSPGIPVIGSPTHLRQPRSDSPRGQNPSLLARCDLQRPRKAVRRAARIANRIQT